MLKLNSGIFKSGNALIKTRLCVYVITLCNLIIFSTRLLGKDYSKLKDPDLQQYVTIKWKLITTWFNLLIAPYLFMSIYCDWYSIKLEGKPRYHRIINECRNFLFNSILVPVTTSSDILFWRLYNKDKKLLMPLSAEEIISVWDQHSMHTVSLLFVLFDLMCVPRKRPKDVKAEIIALTGFLFIYGFVCFNSRLKGEFVYPVLATFTGTKLVACFIYMYIANLFYYTGQWIIVDIIWGREGVKIKIARSLYIVVYLIMIFS